MKKTVLTISILILVIAFSGNLFAREKPRIIPETGQVAEINLSAKSITLKENNDSITLTLTDNTLVRMNRERKSLGDIKVGDRVTVWYFEKDRTAKTIDMR